MAVLTEPEVLAGRRAFATAQQLLAGSATTDVPLRLDVGWYDTAVEPEQGAFAVVGTGAGLDDLIGEVVRVSAGQRHVFVYVLGARGIPSGFAIARRAFLALARLSTETLAVTVEVMA